jgi:EsV-1-7 cysteine-rich motif
MIDIMSKTCVYEGCMTRPFFNFQGETVGLYCLLHKHEGMMDVEHTKCSFGGCMTRPIFNFQGETIGLYCLIHKHEGMIDVVNRKCSAEGCMTQPIFNFQGETTGLYCLIHKHEGMIDVVNRKCSAGGCMKQPTFNFRGETIGLYCLLHKHEGMIDVVNRKCSSNCCDAQARYGLIGNEPSHCAVHANKRIEIFRPNRRCTICNELATNGNEKPIHCETHSQPEERTFIVSKCSLCNFPAIVDSRSLCYVCDPELQKTVRLAKQKKVSDFLTLHFTLETVDKRIVDSKNGGSERPDIVINPNSGNFKIVVEVDEDQHKYRAELCECTRMKNISEAYQLHCLFIRFNPDEYKSTDYAEVPKNKRLLRLKQVIEKYMNAETIGCTIGIIQLYYDGWVEDEPVDITILEGSV